MPENLLELLVGKLREAMAARVPDGTGPAEVTAELSRRLRRVRQMQDDEARLHPGNPPGRTQKHRPAEPSPTPDPGHPPSR